MKLFSRGARAFGKFWWEFLVGDTPELFGATAVVVVMALLLRHEGNLGWILLPLAAVLFLAGSALRGRKDSP